LQIEKFGNRHCCQKAHYDQNSDDLDERKARLVFLFVYRAHGLSKQKARWVFNFLTSYTISLPE